LKFIFIKELKASGDARVLFSPKQLASIIKEYPKHQFVVQSSNTRAFSDKEYTKLGISVVENCNDADVLLGIKEVPLEAIISNKTYLFFSHTTKMQPHNKAYLQGLKDSGITFYDYENFINEAGKRVISFGKNAGYIGAYQSIRTYGLKNNLYKLPSPSKFNLLEELSEAVKNIILPSIKIVVTGTGNVGKGICDFLKIIGVEQVNSTDFLTVNYEKPVFTQLSKKDYLVNKETKKYNEREFFNAPASYESTFVKYTKEAELFIAGHYYHKGMPLFFTKKEIQNSSFKINTIGDISCDVKAPLPTCLRPSTPSEPIYGYHKINENECNYLNKDCIAVMAVDNLPCELARASSIDFGNQFMEYLLKEFINNIESAKIAEACVLSNGVFTEKYKYLDTFLEEED